MLAIRILYVPTTSYRSHTYVIYVVLRSTKKLNKRRHRKRKKGAVPGNVVDGRAGEQVECSSFAVVRML